MAPRTAKAKKAAEVKSESDAPKKGRGKKAEPEQDTDSVEEKVVVIKEKNKRGKNIVNYNEDKDDEVAPAKKGRKKKVVEAPVIEEPVDDEENSLNGDNSAEEGKATPADEIEDNEESNSHTEEKAPAKGRKKAAKKEPAPKEVKPKETGRGKKNAKQEVEKVDEEMEVEEKPKGRGRGRKAQAKPEPESEEIPEEEETKAPPATKGRKKAQPKPAPEKEVDEESEEVEAEKEAEDEISEEPKQKEPKGRKNAAKKVQAKDEEEDEDNDEEVKEEAPASKKKKGGKKEEKGKGEPKEEEGDDESLPEAKPAKGKRGQKKAADKSADAEEVQDTGEPTTKRRRKADEKVAEDSKPKVSKNVTDYEAIDFHNDKKNSQEKEWNLKIASWNVAGIRAWLNKGGLDYLKYEKPNILCLQETKCSQEKLPDEVKNVPGYHAYWLGSDKDGYAGVSIYTTKLAMNVQYGLNNEELDAEGRIITAEYEQFYLICTYVPNAGRKLVTLDKRLKWNEEFRKHVKALDEKKPVIICGDMNVAHNEIDLTNPKTNKKNAGFTDEERAGMSELLGDGFVDTYRHFYPDKTGAYTFWSNMNNSRAKNVGWRLDYFIVSKRLVPALCDSVIRENVYGSDHCPISLFLRLSTADMPKEPHLHL